MNDVAYQHKLRDDFRRSKIIGGDKQHASGAKDRGTHSTYITVWLSYAGVSFCSGCEPSQRGRCL